MNTGDPSVCWTACWFTFAFFLLFFFIHANARAVSTLMLKILNMCTVDRVQSPRSKATFLCLTNIYCCFSCCGIDMPVVSHTIIFCNWRCHSKVILMNLHRNVNFWQLTEMSNLANLINNVLTDFRVMSTLSGFIKRSILIIVIKPLLLTAVQKWRLAKL